MGSATTTVGIARDRRAAAARRVMSVSSGISTDETGGMNLSNPARKRV
jgi:hypothetical protein